jgi:hypothetical protein
VSMGGEVPGITFVVHSSSLAWQQHIRSPVGQHAALKSHQQHHTALLCVGHAAYWSSVRPVCDTAMPCTPCPHLALGCCRIDAAKAATAEQGEGTTEAAKEAGEEGSDSGAEPAPVQHTPEALKTFRKSRVWSAMTKGANYDIHKVQRLVHGPQFLRS